MYYCYILQLKDDSYYHGYTTNLKLRFTDHQRGIVPSTKDLRPVKIVFYVAFISKSKALSFEKYLKTGSGFAFRNKHLL